MYRMLDIYTVAFFGHRYIDNPYKVEELLEVKTRELINQKEYVDFIVGRNGEFDQCVSSTVLRVQKNLRDDNSSLVLVLPYPTAEYLNNEQYFHDYYKYRMLHQKHILNPQYRFAIEKL